jgi:hypothetical protein
LGPKGPLWQKENNTDSSKAASPRSQCEGEETEQDDQALKQFPIVETKHADKALFFFKCRSMITKAVCVSINVSSTKFQPVSQFSNNVKHPPMKKKTNTAA